MYEQPEGVLCGVLFWRALEVQEVQQAQVVLVVLEGREDLCRRKMMTSKPLMCLKNTRSGQTWSPDHLPSTMTSLDGWLLSPGAPGSPGSPFSPGSPLSPGGPVENFIDNSLDIIFVILVNFVISSSDSCHPENGCKLVSVKSSKEE